MFCCHARDLAPRSLACSSTALKFVSNCAWAYRPSWRSSTEVHPLLKFWTVPHYGTVMWLPRALWWIETRQASIIELASCITPAVHGGKGKGVQNPSIQHCSSFQGLDAGVKTGGKSCVLWGCQHSKHNFTFVLKLLCVRLSRATSTSGTCLGEQPVPPTAHQQRVSRNELFAHCKRRALFDGTGEQHGLGKFTNFDNCLRDSFSILSVVGQVLNGER